VGFGVTGYLRGMIGYVIFRVLGWTRASLKIGRVRMTRSRGLEGGSRKVKFNLTAMECCIRLAVADERWEDGSGVRSEVLMKGKSVCGKQACLCRSGMDDEGTGQET
jgi:hypothetical protein